MYSYMSNAGTLEILNQLPQLRGTSGILRMCSILFFRDAALAYESFALSFVWHSMRGFHGMMGDGELYAIRWLAPVYGIGDVSRSFRIF